MSDSESLLRAMAQNYGAGPHMWDHLDQKACQDAADEIARLRIALHDAIRRPLGVIPASAIEFYRARMADEAEARRPRMGDGDVG